MRQRDCAGRKYSSSGQARPDTIHIIEREGRYDRELLNNTNGMSCFASHINLHAAGVFFRRYVCIGRYNKQRNET